MQEMFGDGNPFSDFFQTFFGGGGRRAAPARGRARPRPERAGAQGRDVEQEIELDARRRVSRSDAPAVDQQHDGQARTVDVRIPAGVADGSRVRVAGEGEQGAGGGAAGRPVPAHPARAALHGSSARARTVRPRAASRSRRRCSAARRR